jgi:hypothetical protein
MIARALRYRGQQRGWKVPGLVVFTGTSALVATGSDDKDEQKTLLTSPSVDRTTCRWNRSYTSDHHDASPFPCCSFRFSSNDKVHCQASSAAETTTDDDDDDDDMEEGEIMSEEEENFLNTLALYRRWLDGIRKQWAISSPASIQWPNYIPDSRDISSLETDLQNYLKGGQGKESRCQALEFRIASYYLFREASVEQQRKGFNIVQQLAVDRHPDGLCLYGMYSLFMCSDTQSCLKSARLDCPITYIMDTNGVLLLPLSSLSNKAMIWNHGGVAGIESKPHLAVKVSDFRLSSEL